MSGRGSEIRLADDGMCFACGDKNPIGLKLKFDFNDMKKTLSCKFTLGKNYQGFTDIVHGGILATILDEVMTTLALKLHFSVVTAKMEIRFRHPMRVNTLAQASAVLVERKRRLILCKSHISDMDGEIFAEANGVLFIVNS